MSIPQSASGAIQSCGRSNGSGLDSKGRNTVQGGKAWIGREFAVASANPADNNLVTRCAKV